MNRVLTARLTSDVGVYYVFLFLFCTPSAFLPAMSGDFFATIARYLVHFSFLLFLVYLLIVVCCELASNIRFIPFNVRLNTLSKLQKGAKLSHKILAVQICKTTICIFLLIEDSASVIFLLEYAFLDILLHGTIICFIVLSVLTLRFGARSLSYLFIQYVKIFNPCFENNDLTALWIFTLLLVLKALTCIQIQVHIQQTKDFQMVFYHFVIGT